MEKDTISFIGAITYLIVFITSGWWWVKAEQEFVNIYEKKKKPKISMDPNKMNNRYSKNPLLFFIDAPRKTVELKNEFRKEHKDEELNKAAKKVQDREIIVKLVAIGGLILLVLIFVIMGVQDSLKDYTLMTKQRRGAFEKYIALISYGIGHSVNKYMSYEQIFIAFIVVPFIILAIFLAVFQRKFFNQYNKIFHPKEPVSIIDLKKLYDKDPANAKRFFMKRFYYYVFGAGELYWKKYKDPALNRYALLVRTIFILGLILPFLGITILLFLTI